jgi:HK97 family phage portal protein
VEGGGVSLLFGHRVETRESSGGSSWLASWGRGETTVSGSMKSGLRLGPVYSAVSLIADAVSTLPCKAYLRTDESERQPVPHQPQLVTSPGIPRVSRVTWRYQAIASLLLRGNAVGVVVALDENAYPAKVAWLNPDLVTIDETGPLPRYFYAGREIPPNLVVHIPAFTLPGSVVGLAPLSLFRLQIESGIQTLAAQRAWWKNPQPPAMVKNTAKKLDRTEAQAAKASWMASMQAGEPWFAGSDWDYSALTVSNADARFVESMKATATQIAAIYHVSPEDIGGETGSSMTYSTVELNGIRLGQRAVLPWTVRVEAALDELLPEGMYARFNLDVLARTDLQGRMNAYETALYSGVLVNDEVRALEDRPPLTDAQRAEWQAMYAARAGRTSKPIGGALNVAEGSKP